MCPGNMRNYADEHTARPQQTTDLSIQRSLVKWIELECRDAIS